MSYLCPNCNSFPSGRLRLVGRWRKNHKVVVRNLWRKCTTGGNQTGFLVVQTGESFEQAKVLSLCANLINTLKLLANQQEDGGGLF